MVRRRPPLSLLWRAYRGPIFAAACWAGAVLFCLVLYPLRAAPSGAVAVAMVRSLPVLPPESGRVAIVAVQPAQLVAGGSVLAVLEVPGLPQQLAAADAEVRALEHELAVEAADVDRKFTRDADSTRAAWLAAKVDLESQRALLVGIESEVARIEAPGVELSANALDSRRAARDAARAAVTAREDEVAARERAYVAAQERAGSLGLAGTEARLEAARANADALRARAEACTLRAQVAGVVGPEVPAPGTWVQAGVPVLSITEQSTQLARLYVDAGTAGVLADGRAIAVRDASGERLAATVSAVGAAYESVPVRQLRDPLTPEWGLPVTLHVKDRGLVPGEALAVDF
jgi:multidrug resistance efflux pump